MSESMLIILMPLFITFVMFFSFMSILVIHNRKKRDRIRDLNLAVQSILDEGYCSISKQDDDIIDMTKTSREDIVDNVVSIGLYRDKKKNVYYPRKRSDWDE
tara:strand:+ start:370 stop:675 length:306 start_codon:yes stop_codon:yes gene_type:complete